MKHVLVPVLSPADIAALPNLIHFLKVQTPRAVVVLSNPSLGVTAEDATRDIDKQIADLEKAETEAAQRKDYPGAQQFRTQVEEAKMKRQDVLRDGWKSVPLEARHKAYDSFVGQFSQLAPAYVRHMILPEDSEDILVTLAGMRTTWPDCLPAGQFAIVQPQSVGTEVFSRIKDLGNASNPVKEAISQPPKVVTAPKAPEAPLDQRETRKKELSTQYMKMVKVAKQHNIEVQKGKAGEAIEAILAKEFPAAA
jgi:hypothetical protein